MRVVAAMICSRELVGTRRRSVPPAEATARYQARGSERSRMPARSSAERSYPTYKFTPLATSRWSTRSRARESAISRAMMRAPAKSRLQPRTCAVETEWEPER